MDAITGTGAVASGSSTTAPIFDIPIKVLSYVLLLQLVIKEIQVQLVHKEQQVLKELLEHREQLEHKEQLVDR